MNLWGREKMRTLAIAITYLLLIPGANAQTDTTEWRVEEEAIVDISEGVLDKSGSCVVRFALPMDPDNDWMITGNTIGCACTKAEIIGASRLFLGRGHTYTVEMRISSFKALVGKRSASYVKFHGFPAGKREPRTFATFAVSFVDSKREPEVIGSLERDPISIRDRGIQFQLPTYRETDWSVESIDRRDSSELQSDVAIDNGKMTVRVPDIVERDVRLLKIRLYSSLRETPSASVLSAEFDFSMVPSVRYQVFPKKVQVVGGSAIFRIVCLDDDAEDAFQSLAFKDAAEREIKTSTEIQSPKWIKVTLDSIPDDLDDLRVICGTKNRAIISLELFRIED